MPSLPGPGRKDQTSLHLQSSDSSVRCPISCNEDDIIMTAIAQFLTNLTIFPLTSDTRLCWHSSGFILLALLNIIRNNSSNTHTPSAVVAYQKCRGLKPVANFQQNRKGPNLGPIPIKEFSPFPCTSTQHQSSFSILGCSIRGGITAADGTARAGWPPTTASWQYRPCAC